MIVGAVGLLLLLSLSDLSKTVLSFVVEAWVKNDDKLKEGSLNLVKTLAERRVSLIHFFDIDRLAALTAVLISFLFILGRIRKKCFVRQG